MRTIAAALLSLGALGVVALGPSGTDALGHGWLRLAAAFWGVLAVLAVIGLLEDEAHDRRRRR